VEISEKILPMMTKDVFELVFRIAYKNKFYSNAYTKVIQKLCENEEFRAYILEKFRLNGLYDDIVSVSESNYNEYCASVKKTEERLSYVSFYTKLALLGIVEKEKIIGFVDALLEKVLVNIRNENKKAEVDEITDTIYHVVDLIKNDVNVTELEMYKTIEMITTCKPKTYPGLTNKSIFKCMDIMEILEG
jgi:hypothetical protein